MPEYLAPGVYVEEVSFRSKSIEGVGTTTTGFVGPSRYGPVELPPEVLTSLADFERTYGDGRQLDFGGDTLHNYLWHGARAFFQEGGQRLYAARAFRPLKDAGGDSARAKYVPPPANVADDTAVPGDSGLFEQDGHA